MKKIFQVLAVIAGALFITGACTLSIAYGFTVGNAIALSFGTVLLALGLWFKRLPQRLQGIIVLLAGIVTAGFLTLTTIVIIQGTKNTATFDEDAVLVLGSGIRGETILPTLQSRLDKCLAYLSVNPGIPVIVSGGQGARENIPEAEAMKRYLLQHGVSETQIITEDKSHNTKENMLYSKQILDNLFSDRNYTIVCITSDYHAMRAKRLAEKANLTTQTYNAGVKWYLRPSAYSREALSLLKYWILK